MASYGHHVDSINGNTILRWKVDNNTAAKGIIAVSYIFVGFYGLTWAPIGKSRGYKYHTKHANYTLQVGSIVQRSSLSNTVLKE
jgi:hypothetical protein